ncbi:MAG: hypothetical protein ACLFUS_14000 [Candidatus Sumerlaeia bacterium]
MGVIILLVAFFSVEAWLPKILPPLARKITGLDLETGEIEAFPLGAFIIHDIAIFPPDASEPAIRLDRKKITYKRVADFMKGKVRRIELEGLRVYGSEVRGLEKPIHDVLFKGGAKRDHETESPFDYLRDYSPELIRIRDARIVLFGGRELGFRELAFQKEDWKTSETRGAVRYEVKLESLPISEMVPLNLDAPFRLRASLGIADESVRLLAFESSAGELFQMQSDEGDQPFSLESNRVDFTNARMSLDQLFSVLQIKPPGDFEGGEIGLDYVSLGQNENNYTGQSRLRMTLDSWKPFGDPFTLQGMQNHLEISASADKALDSARGSLESGGKLDKLQTPWRLMHDFRWQARQNFAWEKPTSKWNAHFTITGPDAAADRPDWYRLHLPGQAGALLSRDFSKMGLTYELEPTIDKADGTSLSLHTQGRFDVHTSGSLSLVNLLNEGRMDGINWDLQSSAMLEPDASIPPHQAQLKLAGPLDGIKPLLAFFDLPMPLSLEGRAKSSQSWTMKEGGNFNVDGILDAEAFNFQIHDEDSFFTRPINFLSTGSLTGKISDNGNFQFNQNFSLRIPEILDIQGTCAGPIEKYFLKNYRLVARSDSIQKVFSILPWPLPWDLDASGSLRLVGDATGDDSAGPLEAKAFLNGSFHQAHAAIPLDKDPASNPSQSSEIILKLLSDEVLLSGSSYLVQNNPGPLLSNSLTFELKNFLAAMGQASPSTDTLSSQSLQARSVKLDTRFHLQPGQQTSLEVEQAFSSYMVNYATEWFRAYLHRPQANLRLEVPMAEDPVKSMQPLKARLKMNSTDWVGRQHVQLVRDDGALGDKVPFDFICDLEMIRAISQSLAMNRNTQLASDALFHVRSAGNALLVDDDSGIRIDSLDQQFSGTLEDPARLIHILDESRLVRQAMKKVRVQNSTFPFRRLEDIARFSSGTLELQDGRFSFRPGFIKAGARAVAQTAWTNLFKLAVVFDGLHYEGGMEDVLFDMRTHPYSITLPDQQCGRLYVREFIASGLRINELDTFLDVQDGKIVTREGRFLMYEGLGEADMSIELLDLRPIVDLKMQVNSLNLTGFTEDYKDLGIRMRGIVNFRTDGRFSGGSDDYLVVEVEKVSHIIQMDKATLLKYISYLQQARAPVIRSLLGSKIDEILRQYRDREFVDLDHFLIIAHYRKSDRLLRILVEIRMAGLELRNNLEIEDVEGVQSYIRKYTQMLSEKSREKQAP